MRDERIQQLLQQQQEQQQLQQQLQQKFQQQQQQLQHQQQELQQQEQPLMAYAYRIEQFADCAPPVPDSLPFAPPNHMETDAPVPDQDPPTGYPTPANSGDVNPMDAASYASAARACQHGIEQEASHVTGTNNSISVGGGGLCLGAAGVVPTGTVLDHRPGLLTAALPPFQQNQQQPAWQLPEQLAWQLPLQPAWQLPEQLQQENHGQAAKSAEGGTSTGEEDWNSVHSHSCYNGSPVPSQDPPTGYPTPCASCEDGTAVSAQYAGSDGPQLKAHSTADRLYGGTLLRVRFQQWLDDVPQASADFSADRRRLQHKCSCYNTPVPSQDPPSEHSGGQDDGCSFPVRGCSMGHDVTAPPSPCHSQPAPSNGIPDQAERSGGYAYDVRIDAPASPVPSQDAPSEYPEPESPASSAEESQADCTEEMVDVSSEPLPPGVEMVQVHVATLTAGQLSTGVSHASLHEPADVRLPKNDGVTENAVHYVQSWRDRLEEQGPFVCIWDDYESGDSSVGSPCRY